MFYAIWYYLYNLLKVTLLHGCFSRSLNCTNGIVSCKTSQIICFFSPFFFENLSPIFSFQRPTFQNLQISPFQPSIAFNIETNHLICNENQVTGFYMKCNTELKWVNLHLYFLNVRSKLFCSYHRMTFWTVSNICNRTF